MFNNDICVLLISARNTFCINVGGEGGGGGGGGEEKVRKA